MCPRVETGATVPRQPFALDSLHSEHANRVRTSRDRPGVGEEQLVHQQPVPFAIVNRGSAGRHQMSAADGTATS